MKKISFLKNITLFEILLNTVLGILFVTSGVLSKFEITSKTFIGIVLLHTISMVLHWLAWKQLPTTHKARIIFNIWVVGSFVFTFIIYYLFPHFVSIMLYILMLF